MVWELKDDKEEALQSTIRSRAGLNPPRLTPSSNAVHGAIGSAAQQELGCREATKIRS